MIALALVDAGVVLTDVDTLVSCTPTVLLPHFCILIKVSPHNTNQTVQPLHSPTKYATLLRSGLLVGTVYSRACEVSKNNFIFKLILVDFFLLDP